MKRNMLSAAAVAVAIAAAVPAQADMLLGGTVGADAWMSSAEINDAVDGGDKTIPSFYASFEHFIPLIPNARIAYANVESDAVAFKQTDFTLYYEILDNDLVAVDVGVSLIKFGDGEYNAQGHMQTFDDEWQPAIYGNAEVGIPMTPLAVFVEGNVGSFDDTSTLDAKAGMKFTIPLVAANLNLRGGYRVMDYDFDAIHNPAGSKVKLDGFFAGVEVDF
ncbi:TIGR04219 family outer membrane beta-barrel protein [Photobacterium halotolerans]|uniref:ABC-type Fe3+-hydroxamate transport system, periplasmic component n=1 Tax=Photobacterium halotolerans TaxID=265726 RepID=A0A0F5V7N4_9GAMM|nr:TIGR04219 family outer membrane beta-barrel protein [Photobacterium halotolerans]KKC98087.1 ABC-type Fe3+-hydroxamate transport system, periplasmic component [Photobacterium halotolerans]